VKLAVVAVGAAFEFAGILLVAAPDWFPLYESAQLRTRASVRRSYARVRLRIGRPKAQTVHVHQGIESQVALSGHATVIHGIGPNATPAEQVAYLLGESRRTQERLSGIERTLGEQPAAWRRDLAALGQR
jgi:hypothetical protein